MPAADPVTEAARSFEPDRYLAALYAPRPARDQLIALAAFAGDVSRIVTGVREPHLQEIRLQWWRDAIARPMQGEATGHPIADRLRTAIALHALDRAAFMRLLDSASEGTHSQTPADEVALQTRLRDVEGSIFALGAAILGGLPSDLLGQTVAEAGLAYGLARGLSGARSKGIMPTPERISTARSSLRSAAEGVRRLDSALLPVFLPLALVENYLARADGAATLASHGIDPLQRWWRVFSARLRARVV
jgi:phytoene synthase